MVEPPIYIRRAATTSASQSLPTSYIMEVEDESPLQQERPKSRSQECMFQEPQIVDSTAELHSDHRP